MNLPLRQSNWMGWMAAGQGTKMHAIRPDWPQSINQISLSGAPSAWASLGEPLRRGRCLQRAQWPTVILLPQYSVRRTKYLLRLLAQSRPHGTDGRAPCPIRIRDQQVD